MIVRNPRRDRYVQISKIPLEDTRLSWKARGIHAFLMSKTDNWNVVVNYLVSQSEKDGRDSVRSALMELEECGYIVRNKTKSDQGKFDGIDCAIFEEPSIFPDQTGDGLTDDGLSGAGKSDTNEYISLMNNDNNNSPTSGDVGDKKRKKNEYTPDFEAIWKTYPNNKGKFSAFKCYQARLKEGITLATLAEAVKSYALEVAGREERYIMHGDTFFGSSRHWEDYVSAPTSPEIQKENLYVAMAYDAFDKGDEWYDCEREELTLDNPSSRGYTRPTNSRGQLIDAQGIPYELTVQGERKVIEE